MPEDHYPLLLHYPYFQSYRKQVVKRADLAPATAPAAGTPLPPSRRRRANFAYYEPLTVRDSSLSACTQLVIAAEVGQLDLAHDYLAEAALMDLRDVEHNTSDGVHMASLAGAWMALICGFGGMRAGSASSPLAFHPRLPGGLAEDQVPAALPRPQAARSITPSQRAKYELLDGEPLTLLHHRKEFHLGQHAAEHDIPPVKAGAAPGRSSPRGGGPRTAADRLSRRPSVYRDSSSSARRRWLFPKIAIRMPGTSAHGTVIHTMKASGAVTVKSAPAIRTPTQAPIWPTPSVQPVPRARIRVGKLEGMYTYILHSHKVVPLTAVIYKTDMPAVLCTS